MIFCIDRLYLSMPDRKIGPSIDNVLYPLLTLVSWEDLTLAVIIRDPVRPG
jgi:hypothetical protein